MAERLPQKVVKVHPFNSVSNEVVFQRVEMVKSFGDQRTFIKVDTNGSIVGKISQVEKDTDGKWKTVIFGEEPVIIKVLYPEKEEVVIVDFLNKSKADEETFSPS